MPIRERNGNWHYRFKVNGQTYTGDTDLVATERNRVAANRREAKARELVLSGRAQELRTEVRTFEAAADGFLTWAKGEYRDHPNSERRLRTSFVSLKLFFNRTPVLNIGAGQVKDYMSWRRTGTEEIEPVKEITLRHDLHALSKAYGYWIDHNWARVNPVDGVDIPSDADAVRMHVLTDDEQKLYFQTADILSADRTVQVKASSRSRAHDQIFRTDYSDLVDLGHLMLEQACRPEEFLEIEKSAIDLATGRFRIIHGKSKAARRRLKMTPIAREIFERRLADDRSDRWLFPSARKAGAHVLSVQKAHDRVLEASGLSFVIYDFRHTAATRWSEAGMAPATLAAIMGHGDLRSIQKYIHVRSEAMDRAIDDYVAGRGTKAAAAVVNIERKVG